jgi:hypothetical protein
MAGAEFYRPNTDTMNSIFQSVTSDIQAAHFPQSGNRIALYWYLRNERETVVLEPPSQRKLTKDDEGLIQQPSLMLSRDEAQQLVDELYRLGVHPQAASGSTGQLAAPRAHLDDMRALVFKTAKPTISTQP